MLFLLRTLMLVWRLAVARTPPPNCREGPIASDLPDTGALLASCCRRLDQLRCGNSPPQLLLRHPERSTGQDELGLETLIGREPATLEVGLREVFGSRVASGKISSSAVAQRGGFMNLHERIALRAVTEAATFRVREGGLVLVELADGVPLDWVHDHTGAAFRMASDERVDA
jgi:hypothetical protein